MRVVLEKKAAKYLERLNEPIKSTIGNALGGLAFANVHASCDEQCSCVGATQ
jgi:hypothetical protein